MGNSEQPPRHIERKYVCKIAMDPVFFFYEEIASFEDYQISTIIDLPFASAHKKPLNTDLYL